MILRDDGAVPDGEQKQEPPTRVRLIGRLLTELVARAPWLWPVVRGPVTGFFERSAEGWDERTGAGGVDHLAGLASAVLHVKPHPERILDLGTGTGEAALFLAREFMRASVRGVDISEAMIRSAQTKVGLDPEGRIAFRTADAAHLPFDDDSFDLVAQVNMPAFFAETARVLRPGGSVVIVASLGGRTPFYTPESVLRRGFERQGIRQVESGSTGASTWFVGRLPG